MVKVLMTKKQIEKLDKKNRVFFYRDLQEVRLMSWAYNVSFIFFTVDGYYFFKI